MLEPLDKATRWPLLALVCLGIPLGVGVSCLDPRGEFDARPLTRPEVLMATAFALVGSALCAAKTVQQLTRVRAR